jgi:hypothetical protein
MALQVLERRENFPATTYQYLTEKINQLRKLVMEGAAKIARESTTGEVYTVEKEHIDYALVELNELRLNQLR